MSEATFAVSACLDGLRATRIPAELVMHSRLCDTAAAWQIRGLNRLSAVLDVLELPEQLVRMGVGSPAVLPAIVG